MWKYVLHFLTRTGELTFTEPRLTLVPQILAPIAQLTNQPKRTGYSRCQMSAFGGKAYIETQ